MALTEKELIARSEITEVLTAYAQAQDQNEWGLFDKVFTEDAVLEFPGAGIGTLSPVQLKTFLKDVFNTTRISGQHALANTIFEIDGDRARTVSEVYYFTLQTTDKEGILRRIRGNAIYVDDLVHANGEWRIRHRVTAQKNVETDDIEYAPELIATIRDANRVRWIRQAEEIER
jgi:ketosteroid isomerase-like protein